MNLHISALTRSGRLHYGKVLIFSAVFADGNRRMSPRVVSLAGRCTLVQWSYQLPLRLLWMPHRLYACTLAPVRAADLSASDQSSLAELCRQGSHSSYPSVDVGHDAGVSGFSDLSIMKALSLCVSIWMLSRQGILRWAAAVLFALVRC